MKKSEYKNVSMVKKVGCGELNCIFVEDEGTFHKLSIVLDGKKDFITCPHCKKEIDGEYKACEELWFDVAAKIITYGLRRGIWEGTIERGLIKHLINKFFKCKRYIPNKEHISSCPDAIGEMVKKYALMRDLITEEKRKEV